MNMKLTQTRRTFISTLSASGCVASLELSVPPLLNAAAPPGASLLAHLQQEIARYGQVVQVKREGQEIRLNVQVQRMHQVFDACSGLSKIAPLHINGNDWNLTSGPYHIHISNRSA
jgi:hypothetical protein